MASRSDGRPAQGHRRRRKYCAGRHSYLKFRRQRIWNRWCAILRTHGCASRDVQTQPEIDRCIEIAHATPGAAPLLEHRRYQICLGP